MTTTRATQTLMLAIVMMLAGAMLACGGGGNSLFSGTGSGNGSSGSGGGVTANPVPAITSISPASALAASGDTTVTISGSGFVTASQVTFNQTSVKTGFVDGSTLTATIPAALLITSGNDPLVVSNPAPGGGTSSPATFAVMNPAPAVTAVLPSMAVLNSGPATLTINGFGFVSTSQVAINGSTTGVTTNYQSSTTIGATVPNSMLQTLGANLTITVINSAPGGGTSLVTPAATIAVVNPAPTVTAVAPVAVVLNSGDQTLTISGTNFLSGAQVQLNGTALATQFVSPTQLTATLPAASLTNAGSFSITALNPAPSAGPSGPQTFTVDNPLPAPQSVSPASAVLNSPAQTLTVTGADFVKGAQVVFAGNITLNTTFVSATQLSAVLPAGNLTSYGTFTISVANPAPTAGTPSTLTFDVTQPQPTIGSVAPNSLVIGAAPQTTLTVTGTNFTDKAVVQWNGTALPTTFVSNTQLTAVLPAAQVTQAGANPVTVNLPNPGAITSAAMNVTVESPVPQITSLSPASVLVGSGATTLTVNGSGFTSSSTVALDGTNLPTTFVSASQLTAAVPATVTAAAAALTASVVNPAPLTSGTPTTQTFTVAYPTPVLQGLSPTQVQPGANATITLSISNYLPGQSTISFNGQPVPAAQITSTANNGQYLVALGSLSSTGVFPFTVTNPTPGGGASNSMYLTVGTPANQGPVAVVAQTVNGVTEDVAYVPMGNQVQIVQVDGVDPDFLPIKGFVSATGVGSSLNTGFIDGHNAILGAVAGLPFNVDFTVADPADQVVLAGSSQSNQIEVINVKTLTTSTPYTIPGISGTVTSSDGDVCTGICGLQVDSSGIAGRAAAVAMTPSGAIRFNPVNGTVISTSPAGVITGEHFGYASSSSLWGVLNPAYQSGTGATLQFVNLQGSGSVVTLTNPVGTRPDSAAIDLGTLLAVIPDEGTGINTLLNLNALVGSSSASATLPATSFTIPEGTYCALRPDWSMTAIDPQTHLLASGQELSGCVAAVQLAATAPGASTAPTAPSQILFGLISAPQPPYTEAAPWGTITTGTIGLDPDGNPWRNGNDDHLFAIFTSVITGKPTMLSVEGTSVGGIGKWMAEVSVSDLVAFPGSSKPLNTVTNGEVSPQDMATLTTFIRIQ